MFGIHPPSGAGPSGGLSSGSRARSRSGGAGIPAKVFAASPWGNHAEVTTSTPSWRISDAAIPAGTEVIRFYLVGAGGDADVSGSGTSSGGGGGGGTCIKTVYRTGGLDAVSFAIDLAAGGSGQDSTLSCAVLGIAMVAGAGANAAGAAGGAGGLASGGDTNLTGGSGGNGGVGNERGGGGGGGAGAYFGPGGNGGNALGRYGAGGGGIAGDGGDAGDTHGGGGGAITPAIVDAPGRGQQPGGASFHNTGDGSEGRITGDPLDAQYGAGGGGGHGDGGAGGTFGGGGGGLFNSRGEDGGLGGGGGGGGAIFNHRGFGGDALLVVEWG